jgi:hypothetical protein
MTLNCGGKKWSPSDCPPGKDDDACSDEASDQIAYPTTPERDTELAE